MSYTEAEIKEMDGNELVDVISSENRWRFEGSSGVKNLCRLARILGYKDRQYFGQFEGGCYGDLIEMMEDCPGLLEKMIDFIAEEVDNHEEWKVALQNEIPVEE